jgi:leader peptidase (prepilin peptidase)/N-methyltransferase
MISTPAGFEAVTGLPAAIGYLFVGLLGAVIGSFLNVVIHRVPRRESIVFPNSTCPACKTPIKAYDNIPILGWLLLRGKCRSCRAPISARYPAVEALTAAVFILVYWQLGLTPMLVVGLIFAAAMIALIFIDAEHMILPNVITYPLLAFALVVRVVFPLVFGVNYFSDLESAPLSAMTGQPLWVVSIFGAILGALAGGGTLWLIGAAWKLLRGVEAMGLGDVKMMLGVGALLGWRLTILSIFLAAFAGALAGMALILKQRERDLQTHIPFGIFLGTGSVLSLLFGEQMIAWYLRTFVP